ncbi:MAG TPA: DNA-3-methyladenine glycosylase [Nevskiaceae bacterium]|nr:DNA-3-methyladenine glycosylase [Nevskiaceae bacterium]
MFDPATLAAAERHLARNCAVMKKLIRKHGPCTLAERRRDPFATLCSAIISQQLSTKAADTIQKRVVALCGVRGKLTPAGLLAVTPEALRGCGLSNAKAKWLQALAGKTASGELNFRKLLKMDDEAAIETLDALPGIGRWTAEMYLMFAMGRVDLFSLGDVGLRRGVDIHFNQGRKLDEVATLAIVERWTPYRTVACWYLWRSQDGPADAG